MPGGEFPTAGECFRQPDLARTLTELGDDPELFYRGWVARAIADRLAADGFLTADDLAAHIGEWGEPISTTYRGYTVYETPPPTQGLAALLTPEPARGLRPRERSRVHSVEHLHLLLEMTKLAYADRDRWVADPDARARARRRAPRQGLRGASGGGASTRGKAQALSAGAIRTATPPASWWPTGAAMC